MNQMLDVETIYRQERERRLAEEAPRKSLRDVFEVRVILNPPEQLLSLLTPPPSGIAEPL